MASLVPAPAGAAVAGIVQGEVKLIRHSERYALQEGNALADGDIVETAPDAFVQIEFDDSSSVELGGSTRILLGPRMPRVRMQGPAQFYLLKGWAKATPRRHAETAPPGDTPVRFVGQRVEVEARGGSVIALVDGKAFALFCERGSCRGTPRDPVGAPIVLAAGDFASQPAGGGKAVVAERPSPVFLDGLPKPFRDSLPLRASLFPAPRPQPKPGRPIDYADVGHWLQAEGALRPPLVAEWRGRADDPDFRNELVAHLKLHPEWERILFPERFLPKPLPTPVPGSPGAAAAAERAASAP